MHSIALLTSKNYIAVLAISGSEGGGAILRLDPRNEKPELALFENYESAKRSFNHSIRMSQKRGWRLVHKGLPNWG